VRLEESPAFKEDIFTFAPESKGANFLYKIWRRMLKTAWKVGKNG